jgi:hypothetical protein
MSSITVWVAESDEYEDVFAVDPALVNDEVNATAIHTWARSFGTEAEAQAWCTANPQPAWHPCPIVFEPHYLQ